MNFIILIVISIALAYRQRMRRSNEADRDRDLPVININNSNPEVKTKRHVKHKRRVKDDDPLLNMILGEVEFNQEEFDKGLASLEKEVEKAKRKETALSKKLGKKYKDL